MDTDTPAAANFAGRVAIVHYHLRTGGVTRVIQHAIAALRQQGSQVVVLSGEAPDAPWSGAVRIVPELAYSDQPPPPSGSRAELAAQLVQQATAALGGTPDLWHIHNHCLGKNLALPGAVHYLATQGHRILLQIHDFAEDGRPDRYRFLADGLADGDPERLAALLYPRADNIHYAVLNSRDQTFLAKAGAPTAQLHLLPNAVWLAQESEPAPPSPDGNLYIYPTRAIRRKNLGEFLFWAMLGHDEDRFAVTLAPQNPAAKPGYERWRQVAAELALPVQFEFGTRHQHSSFAQTLQQARALVTTSVGEGFGLAFLEPWLLGRPLLGRNLPEITGEFTQAGVQLDALYNRLDVPLELLDTDRFRQTLHNQLQQVYLAYGCQFSSSVVERAFAAAAPADHVDFGRLDEPAQEQLLRILHGSSQVRQSILPATLTDRHRATTAQVEANRLAVNHAFSLTQYGQRLASLYSRVAASSATGLQSLDGAALLRQFMAPERFCLLRS